VIEIRELYKYYGDRRAVGPVSVNIEDGEIVGLLGLNGAGKTTTLRVLACDLLPTSGTVLVDGLDVVEQPDQVRGRIGYLPDSPPLYPDMKVGEFLRFAAQLRGVAKADLDKRVDEVVELTEVGRERDQLIGSLSHGFRQRVGIAQAIVHQPKLVVLDEPISGLDPKQIVEMRDLVRSLKGDHTVVVSSHILSEISETCDRILVIRDGAIAAVGTERELFAHLAAGMRVDVMVRAPRGLSDVEQRLSDVLSKVEGVTGVERTDPIEVGEGVLSARVLASRDVRDTVCNALVSASFGVLALARSQQELESVFLQLSGADLTPRRPRRRKAKPEASEARATETPETVEEAR
jgi:ABC-2 type transport system ATP-binding protein